jgi:hypothetical protein
VRYSNGRAPDLAPDLVLLSAANFRYARSQLALVAYSPQSHALSIEPSLLPDHIAAACQSEPMARHAELTGERAP